MGRKFLTAFILITFSLFFFKFIEIGKNPLYIFINDTSDHRFDESIRISIMAAMKRTGVQNAVIITDNLEVENIAQTAAKLFSSLRVGQKQSGRGILYLYSPAKKALKIEIGYSLEGVLPDATVSGLELAAKTFIYSDRYHDFWAELINTLNIEVYEKENNESLQPNVDFDFSKFRFLSGGAGITSTRYAPQWETLKSELGRSHGVLSFPASNDVNKSIDTYLLSLKEGPSDSRLDILSVESRFFRELTPLTSYHLYRNWRMYRTAGIDRIFIENNNAFAFFRPGQPTLPIVLVKQNDRWRVQEPLSWSLFHRFEDSMNVFLKYPLSGISGELKEYLHANLGAPLYPLKKTIDVTNVARQGIRESELYSLYFKLFWLRRVAEKFSDVSKLRTDDVWIAADTFLNLGRMTDFSRSYDLAASRMPENRTVQENARFYHELIRFKNAEWRLKF